MILPPFDILYAAELIKKGELVAFPTETVYGLGASVFLPEAIQKIFRVKGRPQDNPLIVHISHLGQLEMIAKNVPSVFYKLAETFFPGPLTILLQKKDRVPNCVSANLPTIGVRMPDHSIAYQLIEAVQVPLVAPSANLSGRPSSTTAQHVLADFGTSIGAILDGGACAYGLESTVLSLSPEPTILRPGAVTQEQLEIVLKQPVFFAENSMETPSSPGMKYIHYAPSAKIKVFYSKEDLEYYLACAPFCNRSILTCINPAELYAHFRQADLENKEEILIVCDESVLRNKALMNRINKACS